MENNEGKTVNVALVLSYNNVRGYEKIRCSEGNNCQVFISRDVEYALNRSITNPDDKVDKIYLYAGRYTTLETLQLAKEVKAHGKDIELVACKCDAEIMETIARHICAPITWTPHDDYSGSDTLGYIVDKLLGKEQ